LSNLEERRKQITDLIPLDSDNLNQQNPLKNHETDKEEAKYDYVGLNKECKSLNEDISTIEVYFNTLISFRSGSARASMKQTMTTRSSRL
jgi:hypothetical protein